MSLEDRDVSFCLHFKPEDKVSSINRIVQLELEYFDEVSYEKGEEAEITFEDGSRLLIDTPEEEGEKIEDKLHLHYVTSPEKPNYQSSKRLIEEISQLVTGNSLEMNFIAVGAQIDKKVEDIISIEAEDYSTNLIDISKDNVRVIMSQEEDSKITMRVNKPEIDESLNPSIDSVFEDLQDFIA